MSSLNRREKKLLLSLMEEREDRQKYIRYQDNPVGFAEDILGETLTDDIKLMMNSVRDNIVTVCVTANGVGKTHSAARVGIWWLKCFQESQCYCAAAPPESNLKRLLFGEINGVVEREETLFDEFKTTSLHIEKNANSFLTGVTIPSSGTAKQREARFSGKHSPHLLFILDEGDAIDDAVFAGIESCLSGGHGRLLVMFNPRAKAGAPYRMIRDRVANVVELSALTHPNVVTGENLIPGAVDRPTTLRRINQWTRPLHSDELEDSNSFELPEFLEGHIGKDQAGRPYPPLQSGHRKITVPAFSYMVLGKFPAQAEDALISREWVDKARSRYDSYVLEHGEIPPKYSKCIAGLDVAEMGADANILCKRYGNFVLPLVSWQGMDIPDTVDRAATELEDVPVIRICCDTTGVGAGTSASLSRLHLPGVSCKVARSPTERTELGEFGILRDQLWWAVREWLRTDLAMLPPDEELIEELLVATYKVDNGKVRIMKKDLMKELLRRSPDRADGLCLTFYDQGAFSGLDLT